MLFLFVIMTLKIYNFFILGNEHVTWPTKHPGLSSLTNTTFRNFNTLLFFISPSHWYRLSIAISSSFPDLQSLYLCPKNHIAAMFDVDWLSLAVPIAYLGILLGSLATFSSLYRKRKSRMWNAPRKPRVLNTHPSRAPLRPVVLAC
jgi:Preprotein translocase subunit Sec66